MKKKFLILFGLLFITILFWSISFFELYQNQDNSFLAVTINGTPSNSFPNNQNYHVSVDCQKGSGYWDYNNWSLRVQSLNTAREKCNVSFTEKYTITYELNGGDFANNIDISKEYVLGETKILIDKTNLFKLNHSFEGWYDNPTFAGNKVTEINSSDRGNKTLYAKWINNYRSIEFLNKTTYTSGTKYENGIFTFDAYQEGNVLGFSKLQLWNENLGMHIRDWLSTPSYGLGLYMNEVTFEWDSGNYRIAYGINGNLYDPKPYFLQNFEKGKTYRVTFRVTYATPKRFVWDLLYLEERQ